MMESRSRSIEWSLRFLILYYSDALQCPSRQLNLPITILSPQPIQYPTYQLNPTLFFAVEQFPKNYQTQKIREPELPVGNSQLPETPCFLHFLYFYFSALDIKTAVFTWMLQQKVSYFCTNQQHDRYPKQGFS